MKFSIMINFRISILFQFAAPARGRDSFNLDMSTSAVAVGKIEMQVRKGEPLPSDGWAMDKDGRGNY